MTHAEQRRNEHRASVIEIITSFIAHAPENTLKLMSGEPAWSEPLVGFSLGHDPLYRQFKNEIGLFYWTPAEIFRLAFGDEPSVLTVISWILPQTKATRADNRKAKAFPAERWIRSRLYGELANAALMRHVVDGLRKSHIRGVAPELSPLFKQQASERFGYASNWSHRHAAYSSGLGTFGLCDGLITPLGKAVRCGSVVAEIDINPTPRPYSDHRAYCLFFSQKGRCGICIDRCPVGALSENGHDKIKCRNFLYGDLSDHAHSRYGFSSHGCGLCQTGVPCESSVPLKAWERDSATTPHNNEQLRPLPRD